jgi:hypothetical protein
VTGLDVFTARHHRDEWGAVAAATKKKRERDAARLASRVCHDIVQHLEAEKTAPTVPEGEPDAWRASL